MKTKQAGRFQKVLRREGRLWELWLFLLPALLVVVVFRYIPMYGAQIAFRDYRASQGIWGSRWVGAENFLRFFRSDQCLTVIKNTLVLSLYQLLAGFPFPILLAVMCNALRSERMKKITQTVTYAPYFISNVVLCGMILIFTSPYSGIIPRLFEMVSGREAPLIMGSTSLFPHLYVWSGIWQSTGWNAVIYIAALAGVGAELYEAARVDGASKLQCIWHIDIPSLLPTAVTLLIINSGRIMTMGGGNTAFEKVYLLQNNMNIGASETISTYVYKMGLISGQFSYSTSIDIFNSAVNLLIILLVNKVAKKYSGTGIW